MVDLATLIRPVFQAPMAGGPGTVDLAAAVMGAGGVGFLAAGYKPAAAVRDEVEALRRVADGPFGVNVFVPERAPLDPAAVDRYRGELETDARELGVALGEPVGGDDDWDAKVATLLELRVPIVSFTFGCPPADVVSALRSRGSAALVTVTSPEEAREAVAAGAAGLCVQGIEAGAHRGSFANDGPPDSGLDLLTLVAQVRRVVGCPLVAAGGITVPDDVGSALAAGADAVQVGTALLLCPESGTNPVHRAALVERHRSPTAITRAFTGRPARGIVNGFVEEHAGSAPAAYPHVHQMTQPLRRAAVERRDAERVNLWAGVRFRLARERPAAEIVEELARSRP